MNLEIALKEENGVVILKVSSPDKPVVIETNGTIKTETVPETATAEAAKAEITVLTEKVASLKREYERLKKAAYRAGKRLEENLKGLGQDVTAADSRYPQSAGNCCPTVVPTPVPHVPENVPGDNPGQGTADTTYSNTNIINNTKTISDKSMTHSTFIPLTDLPEVYQNLLHAWNGLPLHEKLKGLYPDVMQKLHNLLKEYGEASLHKAIRMVAESPFLLGKSSGGSGWVISFGWLLKPGNLKKVLENRYRDRSRDGYQGYDSLTCPEYIPWQNVEAEVNGTTIKAEAYMKNKTAATVTAPIVENCSKYNTAQSCYLDPVDMLQGLDPLTDHARTCLAREATLLGLTKSSAA